MDERFVSLAAYIRSGHTPAARPEPVDVATRPETPAVPVAASVDFARADIVHDLTIVRIAAREAFDRAARRAVADLASDVLGRELVLAPADIDALVARALEAFARSEPVALAVSAVDLERVRTPLPVRVDPSLGAGDLIVFVRDGSFESSFAFRAESVVEGAAGAREA